LINSLDYVFLKKDGISVKVGLNGDKLTLPAVIHPNLNISDH
jgi:hypothetical protein